MRDIRAAYVLVCPSQEAYNGLMFSHCECNMRNFTARSIMPSVRANGLVEGAARSSRPCTDNCSMSFVTFSSILSRRFIDKCRNSGSTQKQVVIKCFFSFLGYRHIFAPSGNSFNVHHAQRSIKETNEAYEKLNMLNSSRHRDTEWLRTAKVLHICSENDRECENTQKTHKFIDNLFISEAERHAYLKFSMHSLSSRQEISANVTICLRAISTNLIDFLKDQISDETKQTSAFEHVKVKPV